MTTINLLIILLLFVFIYKYYRHLKRIQSKNLAESWAFPISVALFWILFAAVSLKIVFSGFAGELTATKKIILLNFFNDYKSDAEICVLAQRTGGKWIYTGNKEPLYKINRIKVKGGQTKSIPINLDKDVTKLFIFPVMHVKVDGKIMSAIIQAKDNKINASMSLLTSKANIIPPIDFMYYYSFVFFYFISLIVIYIQFRIIKNRRLKFIAIPVIALTFIFSMYTLIKFLSINNGVQ